MRNNESGRSMVEMLGVLAIMGILSIGGITGYTYAMNRLKANDIIDGVNKRAVALSTYTLLGTGVSATTLDAEFANKIGDFPVALAAADPGFTLTVSEITRPVCHHVLNNGVQMARTITLGTTKVWDNGVKADYTCAEDGNTIVFTFAPAAGESGNTPTCGYCQHVENGTCVANETCDNGCPGDKPMKSSMGSCFACSAVWGFSVDATTECAKCPNWISVGSSCHSCSQPSHISTDATTCAKCPNREMKDGKCILICSEGQFRTSNGGDECFDCNVSTQVMSNATECAKCPNRFLVGQWCYPCNAGSGVFASVAECARCPNREMQNNGLCILKECHDGQWRNSAGSCYDCSSNTTASAASETECAKCSNRTMEDGRCVPICPDGQWRDSDNDCRDCSYNGVRSASATACAKCSNRFRSSSGYCYPCSTSSAPTADASECAKCSNRKMTDDGKCVLK